MALLWTHRTILRVALNGLSEGKAPEGLAASLHAAADGAYDQLAVGLEEYGRSARATLTSDALAE